MLSKHFATLKPYFVGFFTCNLLPFLFSAWLFRLWEAWKCYLISATLSSLPLSWNQLVWGLLEFDVCYLDSYWTCSFMPDLNPEKLVVPYWFEGPKILVKFCSDYKEGKAALAMDDNVGDASGYQKCSMILQGLADCIACCGNSLEVGIISAFLSFSALHFPWSLLFVYCPAWRYINA